MNESRDSLEDIQEYEYDNEEELRLADEEMNQGSPGNGAILLDSLNETPEGSTRKTDNSSKSKKRKSADREDLLMEIMKRIPEAMDNSTKAMEKALAAQEGSKKRKEKDSDDPLEDEKVLTEMSITFKDDQHQILDWKARRMIKPINGNPKVRY